MNVLITGAEGQLGRALCASVPDHVDVRALAVEQLDITDGAAVRAALREYRPRLVVNAAAYTAVDAAETEREAAHRANAEGPGHLATAAREHEARLIHVSTDFVFDGAQSRPYQPDDAPRPLSVYGATKRDGERRVLDITDQRALVLRTSWLYAAGGKNFVFAMLRRMREGVALRVVADQVGCPTWARGLAEAIWGFAERDDLAGIWHWTDAEVASWYDFAMAIGEEAAGLGMIDTFDVQPIRTEDYPTPAHRPPYSVLDKTRSWEALARSAPHWRAQLRCMLREQQEREDA